MNEHHRHVLWPQVDVVVQPVGLQRGTGVALHAVCAGDDHECRLGVGRADDGDVDRQLLALPAGQRVE